ncbi:S1C family serine protease [Ornithinicoccus hortensis]|uniref:Putative serine protease PepD n=1 Tax=Ornithinicoccus hortensis TaxID=82346 RepID=A0A542YPY4_9MICO|nr:trypsin-like peptidase domain-containing protein [Ornithinicoccus hortensis]TQL50146.1 putative serine protease PepD [Ornithinicoccus hortensis]
MAEREDDTQGIPVDRTLQWRSAPPRNVPEATPPEGSGSAAPAPTAYHSAFGPDRPAAPVSSSSVAETPPAAPGRGRRRAGAGWLAAGLCLGLVGGVAGGVLSDRYLGTESETPRVVEPAIGAQIGTGGTAPVTAIATTALPSVVFISVEGDDGAGVGSGFVVREDGYIVTNNHVIEGAADGGTITVEFSHDQEPLPAEIVGRDVPYDLAVLKVDRAGLPALRFGDSDQLEVGEGVVAVGAPLGLDSTVTAGIVSAVNRPVVAGQGESTSYINAIQTDAAINPGNSGGPLLDMAGHVIGINSAIAQIPDMTVSQSGSIGLGFAIPGNQVQRTTEQLIETGTSEHPVMGILVDTTYRDGGARVLDQAQAGDQDAVVDGGPADKVGIEPGDIILAIDGTRVDDSNHLIVLLRSHKVGDTVEVLIREADGAERTEQVTLAGSGE